MNAPVHPAPQAKVPAPVRPVNPVRAEPLSENPPAPPDRIFTTVVPPKVAPPVILIVPVPEMLPLPVVMAPPPV